MEFGAFNFSQGRQKSIFSLLVPRQVSGLFGLSLRLTKMSDFAGHRTVVAERMLGTFEIGLDRVRNFHRRCGQCVPRVQHSIVELVQGSAEVAAFAGVG